MQYNINQNPKPGTTFFLSLIPGAGHMYLGLMTRGLQILIGFMLCCALLEFAYYISFLIGPAMVVIYIFNLFDAYNCRRRIQQGAEVTDEPIVRAGGVYVGVGLISLGGVGLLYSLQSLSNMVDLYYEVIYNIIRLLPPLLLLAAGVALTVRARKHKHQQKDGGQEDTAA